MANIQSSHYLLYDSKITSNWEPPRSEYPALENFLAAVSDDILNPKATRKINDTLSKEERYALNKLKYNSCITIVILETKGINLFFWIQKSVTTKY